MSDFYKETSLLLTKSIYNFYPDNFDWEIRKLKWNQRVVLFFETCVDRLSRWLGKNASILIGSRNNYFLTHLERFEKSFNLLSDSSSRNKYIELLVYKALGFTKVKLTLNNDEFWEARSKVDSYRNEDKIPVNFRGGYLYKYNLASVGYDLDLYFVENGIFVDFILQQYNYQDIVSVVPGDVVIDAGGCWGDTALYFSEKGASEVYVFEFIPSNIQIFEKNLSLNKKYANKIKLVDRAVWEKTGIELSFNDRGPASRVGEIGKYAEKTKTLSIDDLVKEKNISKVDFIKMDIEGAELSALKGAENTIIKFKPKLAISVYHKPDDLALIPEYIHQLNSNYLFYLDYYTIIGDEIILYALNKNDV